MYRASVTRRLSHTHQHQHQHQHAPEQGQDEYDHRDELVEEVEGFLEVERVHRLEANAEGHLSHAKHHRGLHLHGVEEEQLVAGDVPGGIDAEGVHVIWIPVLTDVIRFFAFFLRTDKKKRTKKMT